MMGDLPEFGPVYFHPDAVANILCFYDLAMKKVNFDGEANKFVVSMSEMKMFMSMTYTLT